jgi:hypothetical protein
LDWDDAALEPLGNVPLNDEPTCEKQVRNQPKDGPEGDFAGEILPQIVQVMRQDLFFAPCVRCRKFGDGRLRDKRYRLRGARRARLSLAGTSHFVMSTEVSRIAGFLFSEHLVANIHPARVQSID